VIILFNYTIMRLPYLPIAGLLFATGVCLGGIGGLTFGLLAWDSVGITGGMFLGLMCGVGAAAFGLAFTLVFNVLAPYIGGLPVKLDTNDAPSEPDSEQTDQPNS
jgi:hypothetical protein